MTIVSERVVLTEVCGTSGTPGAVVTLPPTDLGPGRRDGVRGPGVGGALMALAGVFAAGGGRRAVAPPTPGRDRLTRRWRAGPDGGRGSWLDYRTARAGPESTVVGDLRVLPDVACPALGGARDLLVHLPAGALTSGRRYPVLYMHDGQNLFDAATSFVGEWQVDETLAVLASEGLEVIVVGIPHGGDDRRFIEYTPYRGPGRSPAPWWPRQ